LALPPVRIATWNLIEMTNELRPYLEDLSRRIDEKEEASLHEAWHAFLDGKVRSGVFVPPRRVPKPPAVPWPDIKINDTLHDPELLLLHQFAFPSSALAQGSSAVLNVRCSYGVSIMTSQLGCEVVEMPREQGDLPTARPLPDEAAIRAAIDAGVPDLRRGQGGAVFDTAERFLEVFDAYPVLRRWVTLYHPDTQGPIDNAELAWGSAIFLAFYDQPALVHAFLDLMTEHYLAFMRKWFDLVPQDGPYGVHWGHKFKGRIMIRNDSLMNLPPEIYTTFVRDREARCLRELGGGAVHFCGRGDHFIEALSQVEGLTAINMSQPHLNDMSRIYAHTVDRGIKLIDFDPNHAATAGRDLKGQVHCSRPPQTPALEPTN
jgi:hypothetical protein